MISFATTNSCDVSVERKWWQWRQMRALYIEIIINALGISRNNFTIFILSCNYYSLYIFYELQVILMFECILIYIQQDATLYSLFYLDTALYISVGTTTHHQEHKQLYLQNLVFVTPFLLPAAIAAGRRNGLTNTRCCRYSCLRSWWWVVVQPET